jgi:hypothetical protein
MTKHLATLALALVAAGCSSSSSSTGSSGTTGASAGTTTTSAGGTTTGSTTTGGTTTGSTTTTSGTTNGTTTGTSGGNSLSGPLAFAANIDILNFPGGTQADGGFDTSQATLQIEDGVGACGDYINPDGGNGTAAPTHVLGLNVAKTAGLSPGSYPINANPTTADQASGFSQITYAGGTTLQSASSGTVTLTAASATLISGSFTAQMANTDGGSATTLSGSFSTNCFQP